MTLKEWLESERKKDGMWSHRRRVKRSMQRGSQGWLAAKLGVDQGLVSKWVARKVTPETHGTRIVKMSGGKVTLAELMRVPHG